MTDYASLYKPIAANAATQYGVPVQLFQNLIESESSWNPSAFNPQKVGNENATGISQFLPSTAKRLGIDPNDPAQAIPAAAGYLSGLMLKYGDWGKAVAAYKGYSNVDVGAQSDIVQKVLGNDASSIASQDIANRNALANENKSAPIEMPTGAFYTWGAKDWSSFFKLTAVGSTFFIIGVLLIIFSLFAMITRNKTVQNIAMTAAKVAV
jgi:hypothetical protein